MVAVGQLGQVRLGHAENRIELQFERERVEFFCNGKLFYLTSPKLANAVCAMIELYPRVVSKEDFFKEMNVSMAARSDQTIYRNMSLIKDAVGESLESRAPYPFCNLHRRGYTIDKDTGWEPIKGHSVVATIIDQEIEALKALMRGCKDVVREATVTTMGSLITRLDVSREVMNANSERLQAIGWTVLKAISNEHNYEQLQRIKACFNTLIPYVTFFRMGAGLTSDRWKADYVKEIDDLMNELESSINVARRVVPRAA